MLYVDRGPVYVKFKCKTSAACSESVTRLHSEHGARPVFWSRLSGWSFSTARPPSLCRRWKALPLHMHATAVVSCSSVQLMDNNNSIFLQSVMTPSRSSPGLASFRVDSHCNNNSTLTPIFNIYTVLLSECRMLCSKVGPQRHNVTRWFLQWGYETRMLLLSVCHPGCLESETQRHSVWRYRSIESSMLTYFQIGLLISCFDHKNQPPGWT